MGVGSSSVWTKAFGRKPTKLLMVGLDAAGKTTLLYKLKLGQVTTTIPTIGFNVETLTHEQLSFTVWDVGGKDKIRPLWRHFYQHMRAVIYVVDSCDRDRMEAAGEEIAKMFREDELQGLPLLVIANKQDSPFAMSVSSMIEPLGLNNIRDRKFHVQACSATLGLGIYEGFDWLACALARTPDHSLLSLAPEPVFAVIDSGAYVIAASKLEVYDSKPIGWYLGGGVKRVGTLNRDTPIDVVEVADPSALGGALVRLAAPVEGWCTVYAGDLRPDAYSIVSLHVTDSGALKCTDLGGEELASLDLSALPKGLHLRDLQALIADRIGKDQSHLQLILPSGQLGSELDGAMLVADELKIFSAVSS